jgi:hypothetical protein
MNETPKQYLYHMVPEDMKRTEEGKAVLYPLNMLKEKFPGLYEVNAEKYGSDEKRKGIPDRLIPTLENAAWGDVVHLTAIHPKDLIKALSDAGFAPKELKFYQVDPELLDPKNTTIYLYQDDPSKEEAESFTVYKPKSLQEHAVVPEKTKEYYREKFSQKERPLLFVGVPHIFHKGPIDVSNFPVIEVGGML